MIQGISHIYSLQVITPNYLNRVSHTTVCIFIDKLSFEIKGVKCVMKFKKILFT